MSRVTWIYPADGSEPYKRGERHEQTTQVRGAAILPDLPDFVSPIDGRSYSGRAGLREHNLRHDVVSNADLKGLTILQTNSDTRPLQQRREERAHLKEQVIRNVDQQYRKYNP